MHENREISSTPWSEDQGRSAKATSRTADMYVPEKSDCAVLPVNQPNKGGRPSAEAGEGRAQTRENIVQSHMHPTQSGPDGLPQERGIQLRGTGEPGRARAPPGQRRGPGRGVDPHVVLVLGPGGET